LDSYKDRDSEGRAGRPEPAATEELRDPTRRRFSRSALAGSAVLLSLGNRAAWGGGTQIAGCMSVMTVNSFNPETGMFISAPAGRPDHNEDLAAEIHRIGDPPDYLGADGRWKVCPDPDSFDGVCLVKGRCPD